MKLKIWQNKNTCRNWIDVFLLSYYFNFLFEVKFFIFGYAACMARGILVLWLGIKPGPIEVEAQSLNY